MSKAIRKVELSDTDFYRGTTSHAMTNPTTSELDKILDKIPEIDVIFGLRDELKAALTHLIAKEKIEELDSLSLAVVEPCEPECSEVRHALHEGSWNAHLAIESRITQLEQEIEASLSGGDK